MVSELEEITQLVYTVNALKNRNSEPTLTDSELVDAKTKLDPLLLSASKGIIVFNNKGEVEHFNVAAQNIFGYCEDEVVNRKIPDLIPCPDWADGNVDSYLRYFISSRVSPDIHLLARHRTNYDLLLDVSVVQPIQHENAFLNKSNGKNSPSKNNVPDLENKNCGLVYFFSDHIVNKQLEKDRENRKHALDFAAGVITRDKNFRVIEVNDHFCNTLGRKPSDFIGEQYIQVKFSGRSDCEQQLRKRREILSQGTPWVGDACYLDDKEKAIWFTESTTPIIGEDKEPYQYLSIYFEITDRKLFEEQLQNHRDHLQELVDEQVKDIKLAKEEAEHANKAKSVFLANISHELRTPLHGIISFNKLALKQFKTLPLTDNQADKVHGFLSRVETASQRLLLLLNDLLDLSKLESGNEELNFENHELYSLVRQIESENLTNIQVKRIEFKVLEPKKPIVILCDKNKLLQVFSNIISNAIRYSLEGSSICVEFDITEMVLGKRLTDTNKTRGVLLSFIDQGIGIPDNELKTVFGKFVQSSMTQNGAGGTGLGLAICREVVDAHNGKIWAEHNPKGGVIIRLFLPGLYTCVDQN